MPWGWPKLRSRTRVRRHTSTHHISLKGTSSPRPLPRLQARAPWSTIRRASASAFTFCGAGQAALSLASHASTKFRCCGVRGRQAYFSCSVCQSVATAALNSVSHRGLILISAVPAAFSVRIFATRCRRPLSKSSLACHRRLSASCELSGPVLLPVAGFADSMEWSLAGHRTLNRPPRPLRLTCRAVVCCAGPPQLA